MNKTLMLILLAFSTSVLAYAPGYGLPSCMSPQYSLAEANFTLTQSGSLINCNINNSLMFFKKTNVGAGTGVITLYNATHFKFEIVNPMVTTIQKLSLPVSGNYSIDTSQAGSTAFTITCDDNSAVLVSTPAGTTSTVLLIENGTTYTASSTGLSCNKTSTLTLVVTGTGGSADVYYPIYNSSKGYEAQAGDTQNFPSTGQYLSFSTTIPSTYTLRSDFKTGTSLPNASNYCQNLLYFNNPYYGNIQIIPKITYIPGTDAFPYFINATSNAAYIPNNTISYVYDSVTNIWYIVPASICSSHNIIGSLSTLQYNPTATGTAQGGTIPIDVSSITGSCTYNTGSRLITCTGSDSSSTVTSLSLSAYFQGNTTDICAQTVAASSGTLLCTLPAQNGTYFAIFYGTDVNLYTHSFASKTITIGSSPSFFGRDAYLAALIIFGVAAMILTSNLAVSMVLGSIGLFIAVIFKILPASDTVVLTLFAVMAFVIAYKLKV